MSNLKALGLNIYLLAILKCFYQREHRGHRENAMLLKLAFLLCALCVLCGEYEFLKNLQKDSNEKQWAE
jgi:hypothetical protein